MAVPEPRSPLEQALDLMVFAPIGLAITVVEDLPELAHKGRVRVQQRAATAKIVGQFAVAEGRRRLQAQGAWPSPAPPIPPERPAAGSSGATGSTGEAPSAVASPEDPAPGAPPPSSDELGIPGYDSLSASQVVQRLASLSGPELDAVRAYETATRGRRTILARVSQLQQR
jgi:hypothetical protein